MTQALFPQIKPLSSKPTPAELADFSRAVRAALSVLQSVPQQLAILDKQVATVSETLDNQADSGTDVETVETPTAPIGFSTTGLFAKIMLQWSAPSYEGHAYTEIWRAQVNDLGQAALVDREPYNQWIDDSLPNTSVSEMYYYWIRFVNQNDDPGAFNATAGTSAHTADDPEYLLQLAAEKWQSIYNYASGDLTMPTIPNGYCYEVTVDGGSSGSSEPAWPTVIDETVSDGDLTWKCKAVFTFEQFFKIALVNGVPRLTLKDLYLGDGIIKHAMMGSLAVDDANIANMSGGKITTSSITASKYNELRNSLIFNGWDSLDASHPFEVPFLLLNELTAIQSVKLSFKIMPYRGYSTAALDGGGQTSNGGAGTYHMHKTVATRITSGDKLYWKNDGKLYTSGYSTTWTLGTEDGHTHTIPIYYGGGESYQEVKIDINGQLFLYSTSAEGGIIYTSETNGHKHAVSIMQLPLTIDYSSASIYNGALKYIHPSDTWKATQLTTMAAGNHTHNVSDHTHDISFGIYEESNSPSVTVNIDNGSGYGTPLGFAGDQLNLDLTSRLSGAGWKTLKFTASARCRIAFVLECKLDISA